MKKNNGITESEKYLNKMCTKAFLSLWTYPRVFKDQGKSNEGDGKEICDTLVVFKNHVIIFSDKNCKFPNSGDTTKDWKRWFKRAVMKSAKQLWGAERWINNFPDKIFLDGKCNRKIPFSLKGLDIKFHLIVVAHGASEECGKLGKTGSLIFNSGIVGKDNHNTPFVLGILDKDKTFVHFLDDSSLDIILNELDTAPDFIKYLEEKEKFLTSGKTISYTGEEELLAFYLQHKNNLENESKDFLNPNMLFFDEGSWEIFNKNPRKILHRTKNQISYLWDGIIEHFSDYTGDNFQETEKIMRFLASEPRFHRRILSKQFNDVFFSDARKNNPRYIVLEKNNNELGYVFLPFSNEFSYSYEEYRKIRIGMLQDYCKVAKLRFPTLKNIIGISMEPLIPHKENTSFDAVYCNVDGWTEKDEEEAEEIKKIFSLSGDKINHEYEKEYPDIE
ncbi:MAG: hypothetical protein PHQ01_04125 [Candidatus Pacebacteria bacterium]|nr:hypothetical protein [Candidatus Paceibacterota bacterium]